MSDQLRVVIHAMHLLAVVILAVTGHEQFALGLAAGGVLPSPVSTAIRHADQITHSGGN